MATQPIAQKIQNKAIQDANLLLQKQELIKHLIERCTRQQKRLTKLLLQQERKQQTKVIQFDKYSKFINQLETNSQRIVFICLKLQNQAFEKQPIIISNNLELQALPVYKSTIQVLPNINAKKEIGIMVNTNNQSVFQHGLAKNVQDLKQNINKCESLLTSLKEINETDLVKRTQVLQINSQTLGNKQQDQEILKLRSFIENLELQILKYSKTNEKLRQKIKQLQQAQRYYLTVIEQLQINRIKNSRGSPTKQLRQMKKQEKTPTKQKRKGGKVYLVNY